MVKTLQPAVIVKPTLAYTIEEAVIATGISKRSLYEDIAAGKLKPRKRGRSTLILTEDLNAYMAALPAA